MPKVYIIILNWNGVKDTLECLDSVYKLDYPIFKVIVVDNYSTDGSIDAIRRKFPQVILVENSKNLGFTGGNNIGMKYALGLGADYVWLLNNDTVVEPDSLAKLIDEAERTPEIGLVSPAIYCFDTPEMLQFIGCYIDYENYAIIPVQVPQELEIKGLQGNLILYGTALLIKREVIRAIGYLSEKYFAYVEDCDYSLRALRAKFKTIVKLDARIYHKGLQTTGKYTPVHVFLGTRNLYFFWKDNTQGLKKLLVPGYYAGMVISYAKSLCDEGNEKGFEACLNGFWAAVKGLEGGYDPTITAPASIRCIFRFFLSWHPFFWAMLLRLNFREIARAVFQKQKPRIF